MRCREVPALLLERELGSLGARDGAALGAHLERCPACARVAREERLLARDLAALGRALVDAPDVTARVLRQLPPGSLPPLSDSPSAWQVGWAAAIAVATTGSLAAAIAAGIRELPARLSAWTRASGPVEAVLEPLSRAATWTANLVWETASALSGPLLDHAARLEPLAAGSLLVGAALMATTIALVIGHDRRASRPGLGGRS
jgi:hypothetical protein